MRRSVPRLPWRRAVIVADAHAQAFAASVAVEAAGIEPVIAERPLALSALNASVLKSALVFQVGDLNVSRRRQMLVPALAEEMGVAYVGLSASGIAMTETSILRRLAFEAGLLVPRGYITHRVDQWIDDDDVVRVRSCSAAASGADKTGRVVRTHHDRIELAASLIERFGQAILVEEIVTGEDVSVLAIQARPDPLMRCVAMQPVGQIETPMLPFAIRAEPRGAHGVSCLERTLCEADRSALQRLLARLGPYGAIQIKGKLFDGRFVLTDVEPVPSVLPDGAWRLAFASDDNSNNEVHVVEKMIGSAFGITRGPKDA